MLAVVLLGAALAGEPGAGDQIVLSHPPKPLRVTQVREVEFQSASLAVETHETLLDDGGETAPQTRLTRLELDGRTILDAPAGRAVAAEIGRMWNVDLNAVTCVAHERSSDCVIALTVSGSLTDPAPEGDDLTCRFLLVSGEDVEQACRIS